MNKLYCFVCFIFLGTQMGHGQSLVEDKIKTPFLFSENNKAYLLTKDSIFNLSDNPWSSSPHSIDLSEYNFVGNQSNSFLIHNPSQSTLVFEEGIFVALSEDYILNHSGTPQIKTPYIIYYIVGSFLLFLFGVLLFFYLKKSRPSGLSELPNRQLYLLQSELNQEELQLFKMILAVSPQFISFPELMTIYNQDLTYDSLKKKLRHSLSEIEKKSHKLLKKNRNIFEERRSVEDKRIKCIRIMP